MKNIKSVRELRQSLKRGYIDFVLQLENCVSSHKNIYQNDDGSFEVFNYIDESTQVLTGKELYTLSNIGKAMRQGAFWQVGEVELDADEVVAPRAI
jgi:hypothetical protein